MLFRKPRIEFLKPNTMAPQQVERLEELLSKTQNPETKSKIEHDLAVVKAGIYGEESVLFELKHSPIDLVVLQDLYIETGDMSAQIDFLVITPKINVVIECKNLFGNIEVNSNGDFIRTLTFGNRKIKEGIYSPITQNERHMHVIKAKKTEESGFLKTVLLNSNFDDIWKSLVVLANDKTVLNDRYAKKEVKQQIIRCDQLINKIVELDKESKIIATSFDSMLKTGENWIKLSTEHSVDYAAKYEQMIAEETPVKEQKNEDTKPDDTQDILCPKCSSKMIKRKGPYGEFWGCSEYPKCKGIVKV